MVNDPAGRKLLKQPRAGFEKNGTPSPNWTCLPCLNRLATDPPLIILGLLGCISFSALAVRRRTSLSQLSTAVAEQRWQEIVQRVEGCPRHRLNSIITTEVLCAAGKLGCRPTGVPQGTAPQPSDKRFPSSWPELTQTKTLPEAAGWAPRALRLDPNDAYVNDFLGSVYFLQGNLDATLKHWNRVGKPQIENMRLGPQRESTRCCWIVLSPFLRIRVALPTLDQPGPASRAWRSSQLRL